MNGIIEEENLIPVPVQHNKTNPQAVAGGAELLGKVHGALARAFLPSPEHVKEGLSFLDLGIKVQIILHELSSSLFWSSVSELFLFIFSFFIFFTDPREMGAIFLHIFHVFRGLVGFLIVKKMPNSHDMVNEISMPASEKIPFHKIGKYVITGAKASASKFEKECAKFLLIYSALTILSFILDFISFCIQVGAYSEENTVFSDAALLFLACIFMTIDLYYIAWIISTRMKLPDYASNYVMLGLIGLISKVTAALDERLALMQNVKKEQVKN